MFVYLPIPNNSAIVYVFLWKVTPQNGGGYIVYCEVIHSNTHQLFWLLQYLSAYNLFWCDNPSISRCVIYSEYWQFEYMNVPVHVQ